jgi:hypothetical protein
VNNIREFIKNNIRFVLAITANIFALIASIWWLIDSNWNTNKPIEIEPIVSSIALTAALLGLNFVNDKLTKPRLKIKLSISFADNPITGRQQGMNIEVENHSILKVFIRGFQIDYVGKDYCAKLLYEGFTDHPLPKVVLEPGQAFSFNVVKKNLNGAPVNLNEFGDLVVKTDVGHRFIVPAKEVRKQLGYLMSS